MSSQYYPSTIPVSSQYYPSTALKPNSGDQMIGTSGQYWDVIHYPITTPVSSKYYPSSALKPNSLYSSFYK